MEVAERMARIINFTVCGVDEADAVWGEALYGDEPIGWRIKRDVLDAYFERKWKLSKDDRLAIANANAVGIVKRIENKFEWNQVRSVEFWRGRSVRLVRITSENPSLRNDWRSGCSGSHKISPPTEWSKSVGSTQQG
ncbi:MAG: hypothetical protein WA702_12235 [Bradyrhizobium sp.]|uniref:hypothetical protein n=1 Tax=Bradyrhizobium sp. TaxID=376 RepID=UPI003C7A3333